MFLPHISQQHCGVNRVDPDLVWSQLESELLRDHVESRLRHVVAHDVGHGADTVHAGKERNIGVYEHFISVKEGKNCSKSDCLVS